MLSHLLSLTCSFFSFSSLLLLLSPSRVSSLRDAHQGEYPGCFHDMNTEVVFEVEAFDFVKCKHDDLTPCLPAEHPEYMNNYSISDKMVEEGNRG